VAICRQRRHAKRGAIFALDDYLRQSLSRAARHGSHSARIHICTQG
jgi:hypothetical protein